MTDGMTNDEIVDKVKEVLSLDNDNQLALKLGVGRQNIRQFRQTKRVGVAQLIFTELLNRLDEKKVDETSE